jgi:cell division septal protein FtsQ
MEINTSKNLTASESARTAPIPEKTRSVRRKTQKNHGAYFRLAAVLPILGKFTFLALLTLLLVSLVRHSLTSERFKVQNINFVGCKHSSAEALERVVRESVPSNILQIDLKQLSSRLEEEPWIAQAEIRRILPSRLIIYVAERTPSVLLEVQGELMLADKSGILLSRYEQKYGKLDVPVFKGLVGQNIQEYRTNQVENSARVGLGMRMLEELDYGSPAFTRNISEVDLADKGNVKILLVDDGAEVSLGDRDFLKRFRTLISNMAQYQDLKSQYSEIVSIDLRFEGRIIYRPRPGSGLQPEENIQVARP